MLQEDRLNNIKALLTQSTTASLAEIAKLNQVSLDTTRRDLAALEELGFAKRVRGGAVLNTDDRRTQSYSIRSFINQEKKAELSELVGKVIKNGQTVALNGGTTNQMVATSLIRQFDHLTVITTSFPVLDLLLGAEKFSVIIPGGVVDHQEKSIYGSHCAEEIRNYNVDVALIAVNALSLSKGVTDFRSHEVDVIDAMLTNASRRYIVADSSKFETVSCFNLWPLSAFDGIITDSGLSRDIESKYIQAGIRIIRP